MKTAPQTETQGLPPKAVWDVLTRLFVVALVGVSGFVFDTLIEHDRRLMKVESNVYTARDGQRDREDMMAQMQAIKDKLEARLQRIEATLAEVKAKVK